MNSNLTLNFAIRAIIGEITPKKQSMLQEKLSSKYPLASIQGNNLFVIANQANTKSITFTIDQLTFNLNGFDAVPSEEVQEEYKLISDILMLDDTIKDLSLRLADAIKSSGNSMNFMKQFSKQQVPGNWSNLVGVGLRYLFENEYKSYNEFKVEPLISNPSFFYFEGIYNPRSLNINDINNYIQRQFSDFSNKTQDIMVQINSIS